jgi:hypothetical protein
MFARLASSPAAFRSQFFPDSGHNYDLNGIRHTTPEEQNSMPTQSRKASGAKPTAQPKAAPAQPKAAPAPSRAEHARSVAESAVDLPVGAVLEVSDRVTELVEPFTRRAAAERQLKSYSTRIRRTAKRTERRGASARRRATTEARRTRKRTEQRVRKAFEERTSRAQQLVDQVGDRVPALR